MVLSWLCHGYNLPHRQNGNNFYVAESLSDIYTSASRRHM
jgi:hypothetical protein